LTKSRR
jgi:hypothetical protein